MRRDEHVRREHNKRKIEVLVKFVILLLCGRHLDAPVLFPFALLILCRTGRFGLLSLWLTALGTTGSLFGGPCCTGSRSSGTLRRTVGWTCLFLLLFRRRSLGYGHSCTGDLLDGLLRLHGLRLWGLRRLRLLRWWYRPGIHRRMPVWGSVWWISG